MSRLARSTLGALLLIGLVYGVTLISEMPPDPGGPDYWLVLEPSMGTHGEGSLVPFPSVPVPAVEELGVDLSAFPKRHLAGGLLIVGDARLRLEPERTRFVLDRTRGFLGLETYRTTLVSLHPAGNFQGTTFRAKIRPVPLERFPAAETRYRRMQ